MPYPYTSEGVPDELKKMALYQSLLGMGSQMLQPRPYKTGLMGDIGNVFGAASQGTQNMSSLLGNYQKTMQEQELMKLRQAEDARQTQQLGAQIPLWEAQAAKYRADAQPKQPEQTIPVNGMNIPISQAAPLLGANTRMQEEKRKAEEARKTGIGMQNIGILENPSYFEGLGPQDMETARGSVLQAAMENAPKETMDYRKALKPEKTNTIESIIKDSASSTGYSKVDNFGNKISGVPPPKGGDEGGVAQAKVGNLNSITTLYNQKWFPEAVKNITTAYPKDQAKMQLMLSMLKDPLTGGINNARMYEHLTPAQRELYDLGLITAHSKGATSPPAAAVDSGFIEIERKRKEQAGKAGVQQSSGQQFITTKSGKKAYMEGGRLYYAD